MNSTVCTTCGEIDSLVYNSDNYCCGECGDTEGLLWDDESCYWDYMLEEENITKEEYYEHFKKDN